MPTMRQKLVAEKITENHGKIGKTMLEVGYSPNTAKKPTNLTNSKGWKELMDEFLPDDLLAKKHREMLEKKEFIAIGKKGEREVLETGEIDPYAVGKGLDMAYKLKGSYAAEKVALTTPVDQMTDEELELEERRLEEEIKKRMK